MNIRIEQAISQPVKVYPKDFIMGRSYSTGARSFICHAIGDGLCVIIGGTMQINVLRISAMALCPYDEIEIAEVTVKIKEIAK